MEQKISVPINVPVLIEFHLIETFTGGFHSLKVEYSFFFGKNKK